MTLRKVILMLAVVLAVWASINVALYVWPSETKSVEVVPVKTP